MKIIPDTEGKL